MCFLLHGAVIISNRRNRKHESVDVLNLIHYRMEKLLLFVIRQLGREDTSKLIGIVLFIIAVIIHSYEMFVFLISSIMLSIQRLKLLMTLSIHVVFILVVTGLFNRQLFSTNHQNQSSLNKNELRSFIVKDIRIKV